MASPLTLPSSGAAIVCVGFMGAGKSTAARSAAQALGIEAVDVDEGSTYLGHSTGSTDTEGHVARVGPFTVSAGSQSPTYTFIGARSGARLRVTLTMLPR